MNGPALLRALALALSAALLWGCGKGSSPSPFPPEAPVRWERYLQGAWTHARTDTVRFETGEALVGSLSYRLSFQGDTLQMKKTAPRRGSVVVHSARCVVHYGKSYSLDVRACDRARKYRAWLRTVSSHSQGDTTELARAEVAIGSPRAKRLAEEVSESLSPVRPSGPDSLRVTGESGDLFYFTRQQSQ